MTKGAVYWGNIQREAAKRARTRARMLFDYIMTDGYPPGYEPGTQEDEALLQRQAAQLLPGIAAANPQRAGELVSRILSTGQAGNNGR